MAVNSSPEEAIRELPLAEQAALLTGQDAWSSRAVPVAGIRSFVLTDGPHGVRNQDPASARGGFGDSFPATCFPTASALASTWDLSLLRRIGAALAAECRAQGVAVLLGPGINIKRSPLCGRNFEYFSEDPLLTGHLGAAWVDGLQSGGVGASLKHFAVNNQETDRMRISAQVDERTLREIYLRAFEHIVTTSQPATVMAAYNRVNGTPATAHTWLLTDVLRGEWGFQGAVVSDWGAVEDPVAAVNAGLDLQMPGSPGSRVPERLVAAVEAGDLEAGKVADAAARVARLNAFGLGPDDPFDVDAHHQLAREAAAASAVLLKNDGDVLPLAGAGGTLAVIGEFARTPRYQGAGSSQVRPTRLDNALDAITTRLEGLRPVRFAAGFPLDARQDPQEPDRSAQLTAEAVELAQQAEDVVLFLGLPATEESEGFDRTHLDLPEAQVKLLKAIAQVHQRVVVVLSNGGLVTLSGWDGDVAAVLEMGLTGQAGGGAVADLLFGDVVPAGKLAESIPLSLQDTPARLNFPGDGERVLYGERIYVGYRFYDTIGRDVAYPFGHGLSYTSFAYADLSVEHSDGSVSLSVTVANTGARAGAQVVQFYAAAPASAFDRPAHWLIGFARILLEPGQSDRKSVV